MLGCWGVSCVDSPSELPSDPSLSPANPLPSTYYWSASGEIVGLCLGGSRRAVEKKASSLEGFHGLS